MDISVTESSSVLLASPFVDERAAYAAALRECGYQLRELADGASLIAAAAASPPTLIICEMLLPDEDALTVSRKLSAMAHTAVVPFMIVSGTAYDGDQSARDVHRRPCPPSVVVRQATTLIAVASSLSQRTAETCRHAEELVAETRRLRDESGSAAGE